MAAGGAGVRGQLSAPAGLQIHELYESSHIESAINLAIPGLMLRRLKKGNLPIRSIIPNNEDKEKFAKRCKTDVVVLYDEATSERQESGLGSSVLGLLLQKLRDDGCKAFYLEGKIRHWWLLNLKVWMYCML